MFDLLLIDIDFGMFIIFGFSDQCEWFVAIDDRNFEVVQIAEIFHRQITDVLCHPNYFCSAVIIKRDINRYFAYFVIYKVSGSDSLGEVREEALQ